MIMNSSDIKKILDDINSTTDEKSTVVKFLDHGIRLLNCESGTFFTVNETKRTITFDVVRGEKSEDLTGVSFGYTGIVGWSAEMKKDLLVRDVMSNPEFSKKVDYATKYVTRSVISIIIGYGRDILGIVEFVNPVSKKFFDDDDFNLIKILAYPVSYKVYIKRMENSIFEVNHRLDSVINNLSVGFIGINTVGVITFFNPAAKEILNIDEEYIGKDYNELDDRLFRIKEIIRDTKNGKLVKNGKVVYKINNMDKNICFSTLYIRNTDGSVLGSAVVFQDMTDACNAENKG